RHRVKPAGDEATEDRLLRRFDVQVERLRIEAEGEVDDLALGERDPGGVEFLTGCEVLEIELGDLHAQELRGEARHDLLAEQAQLVALPVEVAAAEAHPQLGGAGARELFDARDPVAGSAGEGEAAK